MLTYILVATACLIILSVCEQFRITHLVAGSHNGITDAAPKGRLTLGMAIIMVALIMGTYSHWLGNHPGMADRQNGISGFLVRYPPYFIDEGEFFDAIAWTRLLDGPVEPGVILYNQLLSLISDDPLFLFSATTAIYTAVALWVASSVTDKSFLVVAAVMFVSPFIFQSLYLVKQALAVALCMVSYRQMLRGKSVQSVVLGLAASTFHVTALTFLVFIICSIAFSRRSPSRRIILVLIPLGLIVLAAVLNALEGSFGDEFVLSNYEGSGHLRTMLRGAPAAFLFIVMLLNWKKLKVEGAPRWVQLGALYIVVLSWLVTPFLAWSFRVGWYFMLPVIVNIPNIMTTIEPKGIRLVALPGYLYMEFAITAYLANSILSGW